MTFTFRPATREKTPLIVGLAGPTKSGKTLSAHRLAAGMAEGGPVAMINAEGARGHQYADRFKYLAGDIEPPYTPASYTAAVKAALSLSPRPAVVIIDSLSHMHDGPGGMLEYHEAELDRIAGTDYKKRQRNTWTAWIKPKAEENEFIYTMLDSDCHFVLCFRAKKKLQIVPGKDPVDLGWQPISSDRVTFETLFTLVLPPHSKGVPDLNLSEMREPFDTIIPAGKQVSEETGKALAAWAAGAGTPVRVAPEAAKGGVTPTPESPFLPPESVRADIEAAANAKPPVDVEGVTEEASRMTLQQILELGDNGVTWLRWASETAVDRWPDDFRAHLQTFVSAHLDELVPV